MSNVLEVGAAVRVGGQVPDWGEALDRYGIVKAVLHGHGEALVRTKLRTDWVRVEDLIVVKQ